MSVIQKPRIALTGATGFLGSHLLAAMLTAGYKVIVLGRSAKEGTLQQRISKLLNWFGIEELQSHAELVTIDFSKPMLGLSEGEYKDLCSITDQIIHCASDTSFAERKRDIVIKTNVSSLAGILEFAANSNVQFFHYISTAYVAGTNEVICKERISSATDFLNVYEESKAQAERIISKSCEKNEIPYTIIRPSIVYGDSRTGRSLRFNALYFPIQSAKYIRDIYLNDILNQSAKKSSQYGIFIDDKGYLFLPLRIYLPHEGALNLIPVDYFVDTTMKIIVNASSSGIYHLTNSSYTKLETIAAYSEQLLKIKGAEIIYGNSANHILRNPAEELFNRFIEPYRSYLSDNRIFERTNTDLITENLQPPEFTNEIFKHCMEYAISVNWAVS